MTRSITAPIPVHNVLRAAWSIFKAPFVAYFNYMIRIGESGPRMVELRKLTATSDAALAARGLTRADEVRRIFGSHYWA
jgi:hypothetical protein